MVIDLHKNEQEIISNIESSQDNIFEANIIGLTSLNKKHIRCFIKEFLKKNGVEKHESDIIESIFELIYNGIRANYMHIYTLAILQKKFPAFADFILDGGYLIDPEMMLAYMNTRHSAEVSDNVKEIIKLEGALLKEIDSGHIDDISKYKRLHVFKDIMHKKINISLILERQNERFFFSVVNETRISIIGLNRIREKREKFRKYYNEGRVQDFYAENIDKLESAGFGATLIDLRLLNAGYEPYEHFTVHADVTKTYATIMIIKDRHK